MREEWRGGEIASTTSLVTSYFIGRAPVGRSLPDLLSLLSDNLRGEPKLKKGQRGPGQYEEGTQEETFHLLAFLTLALTLILILI